MTRIRHIACLVLTAILLAAFGLAAGCARRDGAGTVCNSIDVRFKDKLEFVTEDDIKGFLEKRYGPCIGVRLDSLDLAGIEKLLGEKKVVLRSEAWTTRNGVLHIEVTQRAPVLRFQRGEEGFYMDAEGFVFPLHSSYTADVPVIEGNIPSLENGMNAAWASGVLALMNHIKSSRQWRNRIDRISVSGQGDIELRIKDSGERFIIGFPDCFDEKFSRMGKYYSHILPHVGEGYYKSVNLKYNKQIICRKDI
ncbi:MAG: hypothetical protein J1D85_00470 [Bacteroidales bacterium]|nr:hypothetical protein [Bacteroidales bacterium]